MSFFLEETMPKPNLSRMDVQALMDLRDQVDQRLREHRAELQKELELLGGERVRRGRGGGSALRGRKVSPKYRSPAGDTWAGRGAKPRWLVAAIKEGKKLENFLIDKSAQKRRKKRRSNGWPSSVAGKWDFQGGEKCADRSPEPTDQRSQRPSGRTRSPPIRGLSQPLQEISADRYELEGLEPPTRPL